MLRKLLLLVGGVMFAMTLPLMADFTFDGDAPWTQEAGGIWRSGSISDGQSSSAEMSVVGLAAVSFKWKTSSESGCDRLKFTIDGGWDCEISGEMAEWEKKVFIVTEAGTHSLKWTYYKDGSVSRGEDCGWIKDVITASSILDFTGTLNANGGVLADGTESNTVENLALVDLPTPTRPGYTFLGWFTAADGGDEVTIATAIASGATLYAHWEETTYTYNYIDNGDGTVTLSHSTEDGWWVNEPISPTPVGAFTVPDEIDGKRVVAIGNDVFYGYEMTSVVIPAGVTNMFAATFSSASGLTNITVAVDNPAYKSVDGVLYTKDGKTLVAWPRAKGGDAVVASGTEYIGDAAFYCNYDLISVSLPASLKSIGNNAFGYCQKESFSSVTIPASVETIGAEAFRYCSYLSTVNFLGTEGDIDIAATAFIGTPYDAAKPFALIVDDDGSLVGIHGIAPENVVISNYLEGVDLTGICCAALSAGNYNTASMTNVVVSEGVTWIGDSAFASDESLESVTLPESLQSISYNAFYRCTALRELRIPSGVESVSDTLFEGCTNLTVYAPETLRDEFSVPEGCTIEYYEVPQYTVTFDANGGMIDGETTLEVSIYEGRFLGIEGYDEWGSWGWGLPTPTFTGHDFLGWFTAAEGGDEVTTETVVTSNMTLYAHWEAITYTYTYIDHGDGAVTLSRYNEYGSWIGDGISPTPVGDFVLPSEIDGKRVVAIGSGVFYGYEMTSVVIPAGVTNMFGATFSSASGLTNITVAADNPAYKSVDGVLYTKDGKTLVAWPRAKGGDAVVAPGTEYIGDAAFYCNYNLTSVSLPASLKSIGNNAFGYCQNESFTSVTIPASVETIGTEAFGYCSCLSTVNFLGTEGDIDIAATAFIGTPYDAAKPFALIVNDYGSLVGFHGISPENVVISNYLEGTDLTGIGYAALSAWNYDTSSMTNVVVPEGVTWIDSYAFAANEALESVPLPMSLQSISYNAFYYCTALRELRIPAGVESVSDTLFEGCTNLTVYAPETLRDAFSVPEGCAIEYYAVPQYTVTFDANGGTIWTGAEYAETVDVEVLEGRTVVDSITTPTRDGFDFAGWFDGDGKRVASGFVVTGDVTLTAYWLEASPWDWYDNGDGVVICGARDDSVITNGVLTIPATLTVLDDDGEPVPVPVVGIGPHAFISSRLFSVLELPASIEWIGNYAFRNCHSLTNVTFSGDLDEIDMGDGLHTVFYATPWLDSHPFTFVTAEENGEVYLTGCYGSPVPTESLQLSNDVTVVRACALPEPEWQGDGYCRFLGWFTAEEGGERVGGDEDVAVTGGPVLYAHWEAVTPEWYFDITEEGEAIITGNSVSLKGDIVIPASITVEEDDGDGHVTEVTYPVTAIGEDAFYNMGGIESVTIPSSVTRIYDWAFEDCSSLTNVVFVGGMASVQMSVTSAFSGTPWLEAYLATLPAPDNDDFANATMISGASGSVTGTNLGASVEEDEPLSLEPDFESTATVWWRWTAPTNGTFAFSTRGSNFDTVLGVYTGSAVDELEEVASNDDSFGSTSAVSFDAVMGTTYYFAVGGYEEAAGSIILSWGVDDVIVDAGGGKTVAVPGSWLEEYDALWDDYDGDKAAYANSTAVNGRKVWECYVLDLDPELDDDFTIVSFPMNADGTPDLENIEYDPPQEDWNVSAQPIVKGAATLDGEWQTVTEQNKSSLRFFKVVVELP